MSAHERGTQSRSLRKCRVGRSFLSKRDGGRVEKEHCAAEEAGGGHAGGPPDLREGAKASCVVHTCLQVLTPTGVCLTPGRSSLCRAPGTCWAGYVCGGGTAGAPSCEPPVTHDSDANTQRSPPWLPPEL